MRTLNIQDSTHKELKLLAVESDKNLQDVGDEAVMLGIEAMRARLESMLRKGKKKA